MTKGKYTGLIDEYCKKHGFSVPAGFYRRAASPLAVVRMDSSPPKLVARTWFKREDLVSYIEHTLPDGPESDTPSVRIFDFKAEEELEYTGGKRLRRKGDLKTNP